MKMSAEGNNYQAYRTHHGLNKAYVMKGGIRGNMERNYNFYYAHTKKVPGK